MMREGKRQGETLSVCSASTDGKATLSVCSASTHGRALSRDRGRAPSRDGGHTLSRKAGLTLIELMLALGLLALLMLAVVQLFERSLDTWRAGETRRAVMEQAAVVTDLLVKDLRGTESGPRGDLLVEWVLFDTNGDGIKETKWPRIRLVRQASGAEVARIKRDARLAEEARARARTRDRGATTPTGGMAPVATGEVVQIERSSPEQIEVVWMVVPASLTDKDARSEGIVWHGERLVTDLSTRSFFDPQFFGASNLPPGGETELVTGGVLWMNVMLAAQTSVVHGGWKLSSDLSGAATSWDAWTKERPDATLHPWNEKQSGMPAARGRPVLPRRVRIELEFERPIDRIRRTRLVEAIGNQETVLRVDDGRAMPFEPDSYVLVDAEWMKVESIDGGRVVVRRGQRGTTPINHDTGVIVHWGMRMVTETTVATYREDWGL